MIDINTIIMALAPIIAAFIMRDGERKGALITVKYKDPQLKPTQIEQTQNPALQIKSSHKALLGKRWVSWVVLLLCMVYVLPEAIIPGELTRMAAYKIVMGIAVFFYFLIQRAVSNVSDLFYSMKTADLRAKENELTLLHVALQDALKSVRIVGDKAADKPPDHPDR